MKLEVHKHALPWMRLVKVPDPQVRMYLKQFPGVAWDGKAKMWAVPIEILDWIKK